MRLRTGQIVERLEILSEIGRGGSAVVYKARHQELGTLHALKLLTLTGSAIRRRLRSEGRIQATLRHPNIVQVTDLVFIDGHPGLVSEFVEGATLGDWLMDRGPGLDERLRIFREVVNGVALAHQQGIVHRDLKPDNILIDLSGPRAVARVADFGIAKLLDDTQPGAGMTRQGAVIGTPAYMSPEQVRDASSIDQRSDLFALGCILYELATGQQAFSSADWIRASLAAERGEYTRPEELKPDLPTPVVAAIKACLQPQPGSRPRDCAELLDILDGVELASRHPVSAPTARWDANETLFPEDEAEEPPRRALPSQPTFLDEETGLTQHEEPARRRSALPWVGGALLLLLAGAGALWGAQRAEEPPPTPGLGLESAPPAEQPVEEAPEPERSPAKAASPRAVEPGPVGAEREPAPVPEAPTEATTAPVEAAAAPVEAAMVPVAETRVVVSGVDRAYLVDAAGEQHTAGVVPPGDYALYVFFESARPTKALDLSVSEGATRSVECTPAMRMCR